MTHLEQESVKYEVTGHRAHLTICRPESLNALNIDVLQSIILAFEKIVREKDIRVAVITGEGPKAFVAGADIRSMSDLGPRAIADYVELGQRAMRIIESAPFPVIAAVNGYALGGGLELALSCDIIIASRSAKLGQPEVNLGIIPGFGGTQRLIQRCGIGTARRLTFTGDLVGADEALILGLVDKVVDPVELFGEATAMAETIASKAPCAVQGAKRVIRQSQEALLLSGLRLEVEKFLEVFSTADREEGMRAFLQKRPADFKGR
jgi:enoyl-CoA hydratase